MNLFAEMDKNDTNRDELILQQQRDIEREVFYKNLFPKFSGVLFFFLTDGTAISGFLSFILF